MVSLRTVAKSTFSGTVSASRKSATEAASSAASTVRRTEASVAVFIFLPSRLAKSLVIAFLILFGTCSIPIGVGLAVPVYPELVLAPLWS